MSGTSWILAVAAVVSAIAVTLLAVRAVAAGKAVDEASSALTALAALNTRSGHLVIQHPPLKLDVVDRVNSKAKLDRYRLDQLLMDELERREHQIANEIERRQTSVQRFRQYETEYAQIERSLLGSSACATVGPERFTRIERRRFDRRKLRRPELRARVNVAVSYTSPQGRNSYSRSMTLTFEQLVVALDEMRRIRDQNAAVRGRRQIERDRMTQAMRVDVLTRDNYTCRFCGVSAPAVPLHVDHIVPVSHGGVTEMHNLQTLCADCNLGKSNRFAG